MLDVYKIREDFPILGKKVNNTDLIYFDNAATSQTPNQVIDVISDYYKQYNSNIHRGLHSLSADATNKYENSRILIKNHFGASHEHEIIFTSGTTHGINIISSGLEKLISSNDELIVSEMEHHSNLVPWQIISERTSSKLRYLPLEKNGTLDLSSIEMDLNETGLLAMVHQSNVFGTINPISKIVDLAKSKGVLTLIDGAQAVPHFAVDISKIDCDFYVFSGHKMVGPTGVGVLIGRKKILEKMDPFLGGGEMINNVTMDKSTWNEIPWKFEAGTPNIAQVIGLGRAIEFIESIGIKNIQQHEDQLLNYGIDELSKIEGMELYGNPSRRGAVIPFNIQNIHSHDLAKFLDTDKICVRAGHHCAQPIMNVLGISASARASFYLYNDERDIDKLVKSIVKTAKILA